MSKGVCAIIVTWNSDKDIYTGLSAIANQVVEAVIVDNGSTPENLEMIKEAAQTFSNVAIIENSENLGIAAALNRGAQYAIGKEYQWVLTLDDDSVAEVDMVKKMLEAYNALTDNEKQKIAIIAPNYTIIKGLVYKEKSPKIVPTAITSGQLVKADIFQKIGWYKKDLFIEYVDHEFCFRALKFGLKTLLVPNAILNQKIGQPVLYSWFGKKFIIPNHRPIRYYYLYRNSMYLYKNYFKYIPVWILQNIFSNFLVFLKILFFETEKFKKNAMIIKGCIHGLIGKYGKLS